MVTLITLRRTFMIETNCQKSGLMEADILLEIESVSSRISTGVFTKKDVEQLLIYINKLKNLKDGK